MNSKSAVLGPAQLAVAVAVAAAHAQGMAEETWTSCAQDLVNPLSYARWCAHSARRVGLVLRSFADITLGDVLAGVLVGILLAAYAVVFATTMFDEADLDAFIGLGGGVQAIAIIVGGLGHVFFSDVPVAICAPDLNPAVFFSTMAVVSRQSMEATAMANNLPLPVPSTALLTTVLAEVIISTVSLGVIVYLIGRLRVTNVIRMCPEAVLTGYRAAIAYIVMHKALRTSMPIPVWQRGPSSPVWWQFALPAAGFGILLYGRERVAQHFPQRHIFGAFALPILMALPLVLFYLILFASGGDVDHARTQGWMYPQIFYSGVELNPIVTDQFRASYGAALSSAAASSPVDWDAVAASVPTMVVFWIVIALDVLLKIAGVRRILRAGYMRVDHEMMLAGKCMVVSGVMVGAPTYLQPVLCAVNREILGSAFPPGSRLPGFIVVMFTMLLFVVGYPFVNLVPRFWLGGVVFFAAFGALWENLFESFTRFSLKEYALIWSIVIVDAFAGLGWAIFTGLAMATVIFAISYGKDGAVKSVHSAEDVRSSVVRSVHEDRILHHLGRTVLIVSLARYIFFGSAQQVCDLVTGLLVEQEKTESVDRVRYFVFDFSEVEDLDSTAVSVFAEMVIKIAVSWNGTAQQQQQQQDHMHMMATMQQQQQQQQQHPLPQPHHQHQQQHDGGGGAAFAAAVASFRSEMLHDKPLAPVVLLTGLTPKQHFQLLRFGLLPHLYTAAYRKLACVVSPTGDDGDAPGLVTRERRCFATLDLGLEWVEEQLLERTHVARARWLKLDSFYRVHEASRKKSRQESFLNMLGAATLGDLLPKYVERIDIPQHATLWRAGDVNPQLYLIQSGRLTAYVGNKRQQSLRRGAFVNEDALYLDTPVTQTVVAEEPSTVWALSREACERLKQDFPEVALEIHQHVLKHSARARMLASRAKNAVDLYRAASSTSPSSSSGGVWPDEEGEGEEEGGEQEEEADQERRRRQGSVSPPNSVLSSGSLRQRMVDLVVTPGTVRLKRSMSSSGVAGGGTTPSSRRRQHRAFGLLDASMLNQGLKHGRRIAREFNRRVKAEFGPGRHSKSRVTMMGSRTTSSASGGGGGGGGGEAAAGRRMASQATSRFFSTVLSLEDGGVDEQLKNDWMLFAGDMASVCTVDDVVRVLGVSPMDAEEMIWYADLEDRGGVSFFDFLDCIVWVWEGELVDGHHPHHQTWRSVTTTTTTSTSAAGGGGDLAGEGSEPRDTDVLFEVNT